MLLPKVAATIVSPLLTQTHILVTTPFPGMNSMVMPLSHIKQGEQGRIVWVASEAHMQQRLTDLGFIADEILSCVLQSHRGGMSAYLVQGAVIALRQENANEIFVEEL